MIDSLYEVPIKELHAARFLSHMSLDAVNSSLPTRSSVLNNRIQRPELISPNTVSSPSTDHCKAIIKAIFREIT